MAIHDHGVVQIHVMGTGEAQRRRPMILGSEEDELQMRLSLVLSSITPKHQGILCGGLSIKSHACETCNALVYVRHPLMLGPLNSSVVPGREQWLGRRERAARLTDDSPPHECAAVDQCQSGERQTRSDFNDVGLGRA